MKRKGPDTWRERVVALLHLGYLSQEACFSGRSLGKKKSFKCGGGEASKRVLLPGKSTESHRRRKSITGTQKAFILKIQRFPFSQTEHNGDAGRDT